MSNRAPGSDEILHQIAVAGLDCPDEALMVRDAVKALPGVVEVTCDYTTGTACVRCAAGGATIEALAAAITAAGLAASPAGDRNERKARQADDELRRARRLTVTLAVAASAVTGLGMLLDWMGAGTLAVRTCCGLAIALCWIRLLPRAWAALRALRADMYLLMTIAVGGALVLGDWLEAATVSVLFLVSLALEAWSGGRARAAIAALMGLAPTQARLRTADGGESLVAPSAVPVGALVVVNPGERVPLDGTVVEGSSHLDEAAITGESLPVARGPGDPLFAGTVNGESLLVMRSSGLAGDSTLARMARLVAGARQQRGRSERWVDAFSARYTPAVVVAAVLIACVPPLAVGQPWETWIYRALVLLVIACPCALVIATPVATVAALARAARMGVLIKGGEHLETAARVRAVAFDKTGTLTTGRPAVVAVEPAAGADRQELLAVALALEQRSGHPLARAVVEHARAAGVGAYAADGHTVVPGRGVTARCGDREAWLGSPRFAHERLPELAADPWLAQASRTGGVMVVGLDRRLLGVIRVADQVRPEAATVLAALRRQGVRSLSMLTGDDAATATAIADGLGLDAVHAGLLPADKVERIAAIAAGHAPVLMVGDGVNDAPALARAELGVAMGAAGSPAALETADIALMRDDLGRLPWLIDHARRTRAIVRQNIAAALAAKLVFLLLTVTGHTSLWAAIAADTGVSLLVTLNALRMLRGPVPTMVEPAARL